MNKEDVDNIITNAVVEINTIINQTPKPVIRQWRFTIFPEHYSKEYYRIIFRLIMWQTLVLSIVVLFMLGKQALENNAVLRLKQMENDKYKKAWMYLYDKESKKGEERDGGCLKILIISIRTFHFPQPLYNFFRWLHLES